MRIIADIPHPACKISIFYMNGKYIVKVEKGSLEQTFKIPETELPGGVDDISLLFNEAMIGSVLKRFREMEKDLYDSLSGL